MTTKTCSVPGCDKPTATRHSSTCGPAHSYHLRYGHAKGGAPETEKLAIEEEHRLRKEIKVLRASLSQALDQKNSDEEYEQFVARVSSSARGLKDDTWLRKYTATKRGSVFVAQFSDLHAEEEVDPAVMNWVNGYNLEISEARVKRYFENVCVVAFDTLKGLRFNGIVLNLIGDLITGWIHEELAQTNAASPQEACLHVVGWLRAGINLLKKEFKKVKIPCVIGNHGRMTDKMPHKYPVASSFDWLIYAILQDSFAGDPDVSFQVPKSIDTFYRIFSYRFALEHGNCFKGGSNAISGVYPSISLGNYRKKNAEQAVNNPFDFLQIGDKHQLKFLGSIFMNGSIIGYNEYARDLKFGFEKPQQQFFVVDSEHGPTIKGEIFVQGKDEYWQNQGPSTTQIEFAA